MLRMPYLSLLEALMRFNFDFDNAEHEALNLTLAQEYVRRAALWAQALGCRDRWPFFDAAREHDPNFELLESTDQTLSAHLNALVGGRMVLLLRAAVRWELYRAEMQIQLPDLPDLYAPVIAMYFHHGSITAEHGTIHTPIRGFRPQPFETYLLHAPYLDNATVTALRTLPPPPPVTTFHFTKGWSRSNKRPLALLDPATVRALDDAGDGYRVLAGDRPERPVALLEIGPRTGIIGVTFFDVHLRCYLEYSFKQYGDRFFLFAIVHRTYDGVTEKVTLMDTYRFTPEGELVIYSNNVLDQVTTTRTAQQPLDVSRHWEDAPEFGIYTGFVRVDR